MLTLVADQTFVDTSVILDGHAYLRCVFRRTRIITSGADCALEHCHFDQAILVPVGAAHRTLLGLAPMFGWSYSPPHDRLSPTGVSVVSAPRHAEMPSTSNTYDARARLFELSRGVDAAADAAHAAGCLYLLWNEEIFVLQPLLLRTGMRREYLSM